MELIISTLKIVGIITTTGLFLWFLYEYAIKFFFDISINKYEKEKLIVEFKNYFENSKINKPPKIWGLFSVDNTNLLLDIKDFYEKEVQIYYREYSDFMKKVEHLFKMFTFPITIYSGVIAYLIKYNFMNNSYKISSLIISTILYIYFLIRIIWVQSFQDAYQLLQTELPLKKCSSREQFLKNYIYNNALVLKINKENLQRLKLKIKFIHIQYIITSIVLISTIIVIYVLK